MDAKGRETLRKTVLLTGDDALWSRPLQALFEKEGWRFWTGEPDSCKTEETIRLHNIEVLLYAATGPSEGREEAAPMERLLKTLSICSRRKVRSVYLLSSTGAVAEPDHRLPDDRNAAMAERIAAAWAELTGGHLTVLRLPEVYGPLCSGATGLTGKWMRAVRDGTPLRPLSDDAGRRDLLYVNDAVYGIYQAVSRCYEGEPLNLVTGSPVDARSFCRLIGGITGHEPVFSTEEAVPFGMPVLSADAARRELGWQPKYDLKTGLRLTWEAMQDEEKTEPGKQAHGASVFRGFLRAAVPYAENLAGFMLMALAAHLQNGAAERADIALDLNFVYIGAMGILYGRGQALLAMGLSAVLLLGGLLRAGNDLIGLFYVPAVLLHLIAYLFTAVLTGYFSDSRRQEREAFRWQQRQSRERYDFLKNLYEETLAVKDRLYRQIVNEGDSIGRLYRIIRKLDRVELESIFTRAAEVTAEILDVEDIAVYVLEPQQQYLRQKVRHGEQAARQPRSLRVEHVPYLQGVIRDKTVYVNRELTKDTPDLAAPIVWQDRVIAVVEIFDLRFDQWSLSQQNLLSVTARLISSAMGRAYQYEAEIQSRRYFGATRILKEEEFRKILAELKERRRVQGELPVASLRVDMTGMSYERLDEKLDRVVRNEDFVGVLDGCVYLLLPDAREEVAGLVQERLARHGIRTEICEAVMA